MTDTDYPTHDRSRIENLEQRIAALEDENEKLNAQQDNGLPNVTRRQALGGLLGGGALLGVAGSASARDDDGDPFSDEGHDHSGDYLGESKPINRLAVDRLTANSISGHTVLTDDLGEAEVREQVAGASSNSVFVIEPGAQWTLTDTLRIPERTQIHGADNFGNPKTDHYTFKKGFDGPLATVQQKTLLTGITFFGNRGNHSGDGIVIGGDVNGAPGNRFSRVVVGFCDGDGIVLHCPYYNHFEQVISYLNAGWAVRYPPRPTDSHVSQNLFERCAFSKSRNGGVLYEHLDHSTLYNNVTMPYNKGPAIEFREGPKRFPGGNGYNLVFSSSSFIRNDGPVWLHRSGDASNIVFENCQMWKNLLDPSSNLSDPVGQVHVEAGSADIELGGVVAFGGGNLYSATTKSNNHNLEINGSARNKLNGDIYGPNTYLTLQNASIVTGAVNVQSGIGLDPNRKGNVVHYGPFEEPEVQIHPVPNHSLTVDGDLGDVSDLDSLTLSDDFSVFRGSPTVDGTVWVTYDSSHLYLAADLEDDVHSQPNTGPQTYTGDVIEFGVGAGKPGSTDTFSQIDVALTPDGPQVYRREFPDESGSLIGDVPVAIVQNDANHTIYEMGFPWKKLGASPDDRFVSLAATITDRDENNDLSGLLEWGGGIFGGKNPSYFNQAELI